MNYSINKQTETLVKKLIKKKDALNIDVFEGPMNSIIIDAGVKTNGSIEAALIISEICMGGLGFVNILPSNQFSTSFQKISVHSSKPVLSCLGSQYAGWSLNHNSFFSLGSGPARALAQKEEIFSKINYSDKNSKTCLVLEVDKTPPEEIVKKVASDCDVLPNDLTFILTPTTSICGTIQVVSRVLEVAIHKIHELEFPLNTIISGSASAPIPPVASDFITGMGRTNDAIIYGGDVSLMVDADDKKIIKLSKELPSINSKDYGKPFKKIFLDYEKDFYKIDGNLFSPARVLLNSKQTGKVYSSGDTNHELIESSFSSI
ncbi:MAG: methenyltetrahydromethanopterin cyclohydrolase [Alphaproteobacteria bacterium]